MSASSLVDNEVYEYRLLAATIGALVCCAIGLVAATVVLTTGDRFEFRPASSVVTNVNGNPTDAFVTPEATATQRAAITAERSDKLQAGRPPSPGGAGSSATPATSSPCTGSQGWPYSSKDCPFAAGKSARRPIVVRLKSPWCSGVLRHQPFQACRPRPK